MNRELEEAFDLLENSMAEDATKRDKRMASALSLIVRTVVDDLSRIADSLERLAQKHGAQR